MYGLWLIGRDKSPRRFRVNLYR